MRSPEFCFGPQGIIMDKPSSGSNLYQIVKKGDKLKIIGEESVWYKIKINETEKYIRKKNIKIIN